MRDTAGAFTAMTARPCHFACSGKGPAWNGTTLELIHHDHALDSVSPRHFIGRAGDWGDAGGRRGVDVELAGGIAESIKVIAAVPGELVDGDIGEQRLAEGGDGRGFPRRKVASGQRNG